VSKSNQIAISGASTHPRHLVVVRGDAEATERAPTAACPTLAVPDSSWSRIAADLVRIGGSPEVVRHGLGLRQETASELADLMDRHQAARLGRVFRPPLYAVADPGPAPTAAELAAATEAEAEAENWYSAEYDAEAAEYDVEPEAGL
jgi:hypothetical protein